MAAQRAHLKLTVKDGEITVTADGVDITKSLLSQGAFLDLSRYPIGPLTLTAQLVIDEADVDDEADLNLADGA